MKNRGIFWILFLTLIMFCVPLSAYSGVTAVVNLPETGQTVSFAAGDDGDYQMGIAWPGTRFTDPAGGAIDAGDTVIKDNLTGLEWLRDANCIASWYPGDDAEGTSGDGAVQWLTGKTFIENMNSGSRPDCAVGENDWRMPNINELDSLLNFGAVDMAGWLTSQSFQNVQSANYWVSTSYLSGGSENNRGWAVRITENANHVLYEGAQWEASRAWSGINPARLNTTFPHIWPVRAGPDDTPEPTWPANLPETGQKTPGWGVYGIHDGDVQWGVSWLDPRFLPPNSNMSGTCSIAGNTCTAPSRTSGNCSQKYCTLAPATPCTNNSQCSAVHPWSACTQTQTCVLDEDVVIDNLTGLMWTKNADILITMGAATVFTWQEALDFVDDMNTQAYGRCIKPSQPQDCKKDPDPPTQPCNDPLLPLCVLPQGIEQCRSAASTICTSDADCDTGNGETCVQPIPNYGYTDWRLPNIGELKSLVNYEFECMGGDDNGDCPGSPYYGNAIRYLNTEGFTNINMGGALAAYWSSTTDAFNTNNAYTISLYRQGGVIGPYGKTSTNTPGWGPNPVGRFLWPVRTAAGDDGDGVSIYIEDDAPNNGDGNDDGTQDFLQPLVTSLPSAAGFVTVATSGGGCTQNMNVQTAPASPADPGFSYPLGVAGFEIRCATGPADMEIIFHGSSDLSGMVYRNYGSTGPAFGAPAWYEMTGVVFGTRVIDGQTVATASFQIAENQLGDHDPAGNLILSLGGPALPAPPMAIPTMTQWGMIVFMLLAVAGAVYYLRRRKTV